MQPESVQSVAKHLEPYFDWYLRSDPDVPAAVVTLVDRFFRLVAGPVNPRAAKALLDETKAFSLGSPWEELRFALADMAAQPA